MSYLDLGCFAECLSCELCDEGLPEDDLDLDVPDDFYDSDGLGDDWFTDPPDPAEDGDPFEDFPEGVPLGEDIWMTPTWDPWGIEIHGRF
ncbi:MAG: hypothetical protein EYC70_13515 [Planctomycetota bacterium]|nr:MAG: hypothetical protein EYC70_13515 [Planctomycetota bacterium]